MNEDLISRQAALKALEFTPWVEKPAFDAIKALPSAETQRWIRVSERLPEDGVEVCVTVQGHDIIDVKPGESFNEAAERVNRHRWVTRGFWNSEDNCWCDSLFGFPLIVQPIAWMPMEFPEPYMEDRNAENDN